MSFDTTKLPIGKCLLKVIDNRGKTPPLSDVKTRHGLIEINALVGQNKHPDYKVIRKFVSAETYGSWFRSGHPKDGDVLFSTVGSIAEVAIICGGKGCIAQNLIALRTNPAIVNSDYFYYALINPDVQAKLRTLDISSVQPSIKVPHLLATEIPLISLSLQKEVVVVLSALDDRITLLRETNATLEAIAQALYKSWFVDFDPVRAKLEGRTPDGMDEATAALFPDGFEGSELGLVPRGWRICPVAEVAKLFSGGTPDTRKPEYWFGDLRWFSSGETRNQIVVDTEKRISSEAVAESSTKLAIPGDILIASAGQGHTRGQTSYCAVETYINQSVVAIRADAKKCFSSWLFYGLSRRYPEMRDLSDSHSSRGSLTTKLLGGMFVMLPNHAVMHAFDNIFSELFESQINNLNEITTLSNLRDTLLPRLISGQLRLPEFESLTEESVA